MSLFMLCLYFWNILLLFPLLFFAIFLLFIMSLNSLNCIFVSFNPLFRNFFLYILSKYFCFSTKLSFIFQHISFLFARYKNIRIYSTNNVQWLYTMWCYKLFYWTKNIRKKERKLSDCSYEVKWEKLGVLVYWAIIKVYLLLTTIRGREWKWEESFTSFSFLFHFL